MDSRTNSGSAKNAWGKRWVKVVTVLFALVIILVFIVPLFVNADTFRPMIESDISSAVGRKVTLGHLSFSLWTGSIKADNIVIADDPNFSQQPFFQAKSLRIGVETGAFLFHREVHITNFVADSPEIHLISAQNGTWNYSSIGHSSPQNQQQAEQHSGATPTAQQPARPANTPEQSTPAPSTAPQQQSSTASGITIGDLKISNGSVIVSSNPPHGQPFVYNNVDVSVKNVSYTQSMPFTLTASLPANGTVHLDGAAGPINQQNTADTPLQATLSVKSFNPVKAGVLPASEGISMDADIEAQVHSDGHTLTSTGKVHALHLQLSPQGSPSPQPVDMGYKLSDDLQARTGRIEDLTVQAGSAAAHANGTFRMAGDNIELNVKLSAPNLSVDQLEALLPAVGIRLPSGSSLHGGTLTANLTLTGTEKAPDIAGPIQVDNTRLAGFDLGSKIQGLKTLGGTGGGTSIQKLSANVHSTVPSTQLSNIDCVVPAIGEATGNGTVSAAGALDFHLTAKLNSNSTVGGLANTATSAIGGMAGNFLHSSATNGVPLTVTGTTSNPVIRADVGSMVRSQTGGLFGKSSSGQQQKTTPGGLLGGLLGKKPQ